MTLQPTGYCWKCARLCKKDELFCSKAHEEQWKRGQDRQVRRGKRAGYGIAGSTR